MAFMSPPDVAGGAQLIRVVYRQIQIETVNPFFMTSPTSSLTVRKTLPCSVEEAFQTWTQPKLFQQWFAPDPAMKTVADFDLRPGGKYRIGFQPPGGKPTMFVGGEFLVV